MKIKKQPTAYRYKATVERVVDGDTVDVMIEFRPFGIFKKARVRLYGINVPETRTRDKREKVLGLEVKGYVGNLIENQEVRIVIDELGKFGRALGMVFYNGHKKSLNQELVDIGYAKTYYGGHRDKWFPDGKK